MNSKVNLRKHLGGNKHRKTSISYKSQLTKKSLFSTEIDDEKLEELNEKALNAVMVDCLPFNVFTKPGKLILLIN